MHKIKYIGLPGKRIILNQPPSVQGKKMLALAEGVGRAWTRTAEMREKGPAVLRSSKEIKIYTSGLRTGPQSFLFNWPGAQPGSRDLRGLLGCAARDENQDLYLSFRNCNMHRNHPWKCFSLAGRDAEGFL